MGPGVATVMIVLSFSTTNGTARLGLVNPYEYRTLAEIDDGSYIDLPRWAPSQGLCVGTTCSAPRTTTTEEPR